VRAGLGESTLIKLPERISSVLDGLLEDLKSRESISGVGLFGSWSRGDAVSSSDIDLLLLDSRSFDYEYVERAEIDNCLLDLDYIPKKWVQQNIPPEIDQKLYEARTLFDRDSALTNAKDLISKVYLEPERVEIRTEAYLMEADIYLSRAASAYNRDDFQSASLNASLGLETILKTFIEVNKMPISNSHLMAALEDSSKKLGMINFYDDYLRNARFSKLDRQRTVNMFNSFSALWRTAVDFIGANSSTVKTLHVRVKNRLNYYGKESFLKGVLARTKSLIEDGLFLEAVHYMGRTSVDMLENYAWLASMVEGTRFDHAVLFQYLKGSRTSPKEVYYRAIEMFGIEEVSSREAEEALNRAKENILSIRQRRRELIMSRLGT